MNEYGGERFAGVQSSVYKYINSPRGWTNTSFNLCIGANSFSSQLTRRLEELERALTCVKGIASGN
jgi:hypothetical protein